MTFGFGFFVQNALLGVGLAMDAFSVSVANGLNEPCMKKRKMLGVAGMFAFFQALMPMLGWICVHTIVQYFQAFEKIIPWIALILLGFIGGKMIYEGFGSEEDDQCSKPGLGFGALVVQGIATSIDALSVGFTIAGYDVISALVAALVIAVITFIICMGGIYIGKSAGSKLSGKAGIFGGIILVAIGVEIFLTGTGIIKF
ncbi:MAG: manganese efflux pump [Ruminococcaceae bacterium]|nr:manganese efflux pump [Oscillospiraceae bacterium]